MKIRSSRTHARLALVATIAASLTACALPPDDAAYLTTADLDSTSHRSPAPAGHEHGDAHDQTLPLPAFPTDHYGDPPAPSRDLRGILIVADDVTTPAGIPVRVRIYAHYYTAPEIDVTPWAVLSSSDPSIAHAGNLQYPYRMVPTGEQGTATLTASFQGRTATRVITVTEPTTLGLTVCPPTGCRTNVGQHMTIEPRRRLSDGTHTTAQDASVVWIANSAIAELSPILPGLWQLTGLAEGTTTAAFALPGDGTVTIFEIEVGPPQPFEIQAALGTVSGQTTFEVGDTIAIFASVVDVLGDPIVGASKIDIITTDPSIIASTHAGSSLVAVGGGAAGVYLFYEGVWTMIQVTVTGPPLASLEVTPALTTDASVGQQIALNADGINCYSGPLPCSTHTLTSVVTWSSDHPEVATVSDDGIVTIHGAGIALVRATLGYETTTAVVTSG